ncbi:ATP-binding protein [Nocardioides gilvus]|uniref:ATP-binding protein n=1 Tax=Nocardioides gilvus TaxID=1735589 RepID=UPI000D74F2A4|nr:ATP-binding protein [Nocardioides gilvus]
MPLNKEALQLEPAPSSVARARRWIIEACEDLGRTDLIECAELGVSELVTNAILHGEAPVSIRVRGTVHHPRIEIFDASRRPPVLPREPASYISLDEVDEADLATSGRGLAMVAMSSIAWGASIERGGKVVWFEPARAHHDEYPEGVIVGDLNPDSSDWTPLPDSMIVTLCQVDVPVFQSMLTQYANLRRELRLLSLSHDTEYPLAGDLSQMFDTFEHQFPPATLAKLAAGLRETGPVSDFAFRASPRSSQVFRTILEMFELADTFCRSQRLLALARTPEHIEMQQWLLSEFLNQADGKDPTPWSSRLTRSGHSNGC